MRRLSRRACLIAGLATIAGTRPALTRDDSARRDLDALVAAYTDELAGHADNMLLWHDGTVMPVSDSDEHKTFAELLHHPSIIDMSRIAYPRGALKKPPTVDSDPGRFRNRAFFAKMYGDCKKGDVVPRLASLDWLPKTWGKTIQMTSVNRVHERLRAVSTEIDALPEKVKHAAYPIAGTYNCRAVADTGEPSPHSYGIAIDLNLAFSDYWHWLPRGREIVYRNRMPQEIVDTFEKHGFIWGGKWYHYDTMHFEYRPELLAVAD
jgi:hypothetical protein